MTRYSHRVVHIVFYYHGIEYNWFATNHSTTGMQTNIHTPTHTHTHKHKHTRTHTHTRTHAHTHVTYLMRLSSILRICVPGSSFVERIRHDAAPCVLLPPPASWKAGRELR